MSTSWWLHCPEHGVTMEGDGLNHGQDKLRRLWAARAKVATAMELTTELDVEVELSAWYMTGYHLRFVVEHAACPVRLVNEYGDHEPLEPIPPCPEWARVFDVDRTCQLGRDHYGSHRHRTHRVLLEWAT